MAAVDGWRESERGLWHRGPFRISAVPLPDGWRFNLYHGARRVATGRDAEALRAHPSVVAWVEIEGAP